MHRFVLIFCCFLLAGSTVRAQSVFSGRVLENKTRIALRGVRVENLNNKLKGITAGDGTFSIGAKVGDLIVFKAFAYQPDTVLLTTMYSREVFLTPQTNMLNQVNITDSSGRSSQAEKNAKLGYDKEFHGQTVYAHRDINGNFDGGATIRMHYFTKDDRNKRKASQKAADRKKEEEIERIYVASNIETYVPLKGVDMDNFLLLYTPDVKTYTAKSYDFVSYLNMCYKEWQTLTPEQKKAGQIFK